MNSRPSYSTGAYSRRMQMSSANSTFLIVEGKEHDRWYFEKLANLSRVVCDRGVLAYRAEAIGRNLNENFPGGKAAVLRLHKEFKESGSLNIENHGNAKKLVFCLDADHDRIMRSMIRSKHVIYTLLPDVEAHLISDCEQRDLIALLLSISYREAVQVELWLGDWIREYAQECKEWFVLCHTSSKLDLESCPNPDTPPPLRPQGRASIRGEKLEPLRQKIAASNNPEKAEIEASVRRRIEKIYSTGRHLELLKGKWISAYLSRLLNEYAHKFDTGSPGNATSIIATCKAMGTPGKRWARYFHCKDFSDSYRRLTFSFRRRVWHLFAGKSLGERPDR